MANWLAGIQRELKGVGFVTLYFLFCFGIILTLKKLFLEAYRIEFYALSTAVVSAFLAAKIVVSLDHTRAGTRFDASRPLIVAVSYKTLIYGAGAFGVLLVERLFHAYRAADSLAAAMTDVWAHRDRNVILAKAICVGLTFAGYHLYNGIDRRLGEGTLRRIVTTGKGDEPGSRPRTSGGRRVRQRDEGQAGRERPQDQRRRYAKDSGDT